MGCFSFLCKECGEPILSNSFRGQQVKLFLLKNSEIIQEMEDYLKQLRAEAKGVEERIAELKKED